jgi:hypothetical protein
MAFTAGGITYPLEIADVVTVDAAWPSCENGRGVAMRDPEFVQVIDDGFRVGELELAVKLEAVSGARKS